MAIFESVLDDNPQNKVALAGLSHQSGTARASGAMDGGVVTGRGGIIPPPKQVFR